MVMSLVDRWLTVVRASTTHLSPLLVSGYPGTFFTPTFGYLLTKTPEISKSSGKAMERLWVRVLVMEPLSRIGRNVTLGERDNCDIYNRRNKMKKGVKNEYLFRGAGKKRVRRC